MPRFRSEEGGRKMCVAIVQISPLRGDMDAVRSKTIAAEDSDDTGLLKPGERSGVDATEVKTAGI